MHKKAGFSLIETTIALLVLALIAAVALSEYDDLKKWEEYAAQNNCVVASTERGRWYSVPDGQGGSTPHKSADRKTYRCEDGTTHTR